MHCTAHTHYKKNYFLLISIEKNSCSPHDKYRLTTYAIKKNNTKLIDTRDRDSKLSIAGKVKKKHRCWFVCKTSTDHSSSFLTICLTRIAATGFTCSFFFQFLLLSDQRKKKSPNYITIIKIKLLFFPYIYNIHTYKYPFTTSITN